MSNRWGIDEDVSAGFIFTSFFPEKFVLGRDGKTIEETLHKRNSSSYSFSSEMNQGCCILPSKVILRFFLQYPRQ